jgi:aspartyl aminopeptidase
MRNQNRKRKKRQQQKKQQQKEKRKVMDRIQDLIQFLDASPTSWHAISWIKDRLRSKGFVELKEQDQWTLEAGGRYFSCRQGASLCAFVLPQLPLEHIHIIATHTDSPGFKLKPKAEFQKENMTLFAVEVYGSPLLSSWLNRDLGVAGLVSFVNHRDELEEALLTIDNHPIVIPQLAIHLDRQVNDQGVQLNKQEHLNVLACLNDTKENAEDALLEKWIAEKVKFKTMLAHDLFLFPLERARLIGDDKEMIASYRIDSLNSAHAALLALCQEGFVEDHQLRVAIFSHHEEVGSGSAHGASSPYLMHQLERIAIGMDLTREAFLRLLPRSLCLSVDLAHGMHPNHADKLESHHPVLLSKGVVVKFNAQQRYATDAYAAARLIALCQKENIEIQKFVSRNDVPCGTTLGPIHSQLTGVPTVDIGCPQLSMHSCREIASCQDHLQMCRLLDSFYKTTFFKTHQSL